MVANSLVPTKVDADLAPSAEQPTAQGACRAAHLHLSGVATGHEPLTMDRSRTAVLAGVFPQRVRPYCRSYRATSDNWRHGPSRRQSRRAVVS